MLDSAMAKIIIEELTYASNMWWQTYMSTVFTARVARTVEPKTDEPLHWYPSGHY